MNDKGFTLIELLAVVLILGMLMTIVVPNMAGITNSNKAINYVEDAKKLKTSVEYLFRSNNEIPRPTNNDCVIFNIKYVHDSEFDSPPNGGVYNRQKSFVIITYDSSDHLYQYYVQLVEDTPGGKASGVSLTKYVNLNNDEYESMIVEEFPTFIDKSGTSLSIVNLPSMVNCSGSKHIFYAEY